MYILKLLIFLQLLFLVISNQNINPSPRTGPQDLLVTHYDCEENEQKTLHKYAINQVSQCETEPQAIETTNVIATLYSKARATTVIGYKFTATFSEKKVHCSQVSNGNKNRLDHESFYQSNIERLLHLSPEDCKNELLRLNITKNKNTDRNLVYFQVFSDSVHQAELERYQGHIKLDEKYPYNGAHGRLTYDMHDKHWIPHIGINDPSNCKADTKNKGYQEIMFFDWKIQLEKIQLTRDLSDNTMIYQGIRLPCKNDQSYCDPTTRTQATIVWFPEDTCTTFQVAKIHARMIKFHEKYFIQSIPYEQVNPLRKISSNFRNIHNIENKLTRFQIYQETELACKYRNPLHKTQYSEILVEYENGFDMTTGKIKVDPYATSHPLNEGTSYIPVNFQKNTGQPGGHLKPQDDQSTRLQELSLMNSTYFGNIHYDIHLDMKLDYTISRIFQEMSLSELETLHQLCELERTQILQSLALAVLKMFNFIGFLFSLLKGIYNTCAIHTQVNRQASVARILFVGFFGIFSTSINKILLDAQIKEYNTKIATRQNTYDEEHNNADTTPTAPQLPPLPHNHPLSLVPRNFRNLAITHNNFRPTISQSPIQHIMPHHSQDENTYEQIIEQPHTTAFQSQNNNFF